MPRDNYHPLPEPVPQIMPGMRFIFCDIDGVIANDWHRRDLLPKGPDLKMEDFANYHEYLDMDTLNIEVMEHVFDVQRVNRPCVLILITSRPEFVRMRTEAWLDHHRVHYQRLLMRGETDLTPPADLKVQMVEGFFEKSIHRVSTRIATVLDDDREVCNAFAHHYIKTTYVHNNPETKEIRILPWRD